MDVEFNDEGGHYNQPSLNTDNPHQLKQFISDELALQKKELAEKVMKERQKVWVGYHNSQEWSKQKEAVKPYDNLLALLEEA